MNNSLAVFSMMKDITKSLPGYIPRLKLLGCAFLGQMESQF